jgi:ATP-dependent DNA ligase
MASEKRDFVHFDKFPGEIIAEQFRFPTLYYEDSSGKLRVWDIIVRLVKDKKKRPNHGHDWDLLVEDQIPVVNGYLRAKDLPPNTVAQFWVETGVVGGKIMRHPPTYPVETNVDRANERNTFEQSLVDARSKYLKKREEGGRTEKEFKALKKAAAAPCKQDLNKSTAYFPMLARKFDEEAKHVEWPAIGQPKLDGVRCQAFLNVNPHRVARHLITYKNVMLYTRQRKEFQGFEHIRRLLLEPLIEMYSEDNYSLYLDGEFYKHGESLQDISGQVRNVKKNSKVNRESVQYNIYDCFYPNALVSPFSERTEILEDFFSVFDSSDVDWDGFDADPVPKGMIKRVPCVEIKNEKEMRAQYKKWLKEKYEGLMYRNPASPYLAHPTKTGTFLRSHGLLKLKMRYSDEFELVGFTEGTKGRDVGAIMWICQTSGEKKFHATPKNMTLPERYALFKKIPEQFDDTYKGRLMTIEYEDLSKDGIPLRAKAVGIRDYE